MREHNNKEKNKNIFEKKDDASRTIINKNIVNISKEVYKFIRFLIFSYFGFSLKLFNTAVPNLPLQNDPNYPKTEY